MPALPPVIDRLVAAANEHDIDRLSDCFAHDFVNTTPAHPMRGFTGREQVRRNWTMIFAGIPDIQARVLAASTADDDVWTEWEMRGTRRDGVEQAMAGVIVFRVTGERIGSARFYLEPVETSTGDVEAAVAAHAVGPS
jgi:ketosteroid isomerase-like protein